MKEKNAAGRPDSLGTRLAKAILALPRETKRFIMAIADAVAIPTALWAALVLKFDTLNPSADRTFSYFVVAVVSALFFFAVFGLYRTVIRFVGPKAMLTVLAGVSLSVLVLALFDRFFASHQIPLTALGIYGALALLYVGGSRFAARYLFQHTGVRGRSVTRVAIYGAGTAGAHISSVLLSGADYDPVAFIDDKKSLHGSSINGVRVYGSDVLPKLVRQHRIDRVLLAMPATTRRRRREILAQLEPLGVRVQSLPSLPDLIAGNAQISELCDVEVERPAGPRPGAAEAEAVRLLHPRQVRDGDRRRRLDRLGAVPADHSPGAQPPGAVRDVRDRPVHHRARTARPIAASERIEVEIVPLLGNAHHRHRVREVLSALRGADRLPRRRLQARADRRAQRRRGHPQQRDRHLVYRRGGAGDRCRDLRADLDRQGGAARPMSWAPPSAWPNWCLQASAGAHHRTRASAWCASATCSARPVRWCRCSRSRSAAVAR